MINNKFIIKNLIENISDEEISIFEKKGIIFDETRKKIIKNSDSLDFQAVPGSGKTTLLVTKLLLIADKWDFKNKGICVLSHTNVAKDEIYKKINESGIGKNLLKYPHFIGTIQGFVDKYLGIPAIKYNNFNFSTVDSEFYNSYAKKKLNFKARNYLDRKNVTNLYGLKLEFKNEELILNVPGFEKKSKSDTYINLLEIKKKLIKEGIYLYSELFDFSNYLIDKFPKIEKIIRNRFPLVFIDEAQDNNDIQENLLEKIFHSDDCIYQRFGDQDQAIYDFEGAVRTKDFPDRCSDINISDSKRFSDKHLKYINPFKISNNIKLEASGNCCKMEPKFLFYQKKDMQKPIRKFLDLVDDYFEPGSNPVVKIVGFVGNTVESENQKKIGSYINNYIKNRVADKYDYLIYLVYALKEKSGDFYKNYYDILKFILLKCKIIYNNKRLSVRNKRLINEYLKSQEALFLFKNLVLKILLNKIDKGLWKEFSDQILDIFQINIESEKKFFEYKENFCETNSSNQACQLLSCDNINCLYTPKNNIKVEVCTIHSVKGETHDATLVLETKGNIKEKGGDISYVFIGNKKADKYNKYKKQLYVATTRAKSLLCIAVEDNEETREKIEKIEGKGHYGF